MLLFVPSVLISVAVSTAGTCEEPAAAVHPRAQGALDAMDAMDAPPALDAVGALSAPRDCLGALSLRHA